MSAFARIRRLLETCPDADAELVARICQCPKRLVQSVRWSIVNKDAAREKNRLHMRRKRAAAGKEART